MARHRSKKSIAIPTPRRRSWLGYATLIGLGLGLGTFFFNGNGDRPAPRRVPPSPPVVDTEQIDPAIDEAVQAARRQVLQHPRDANAWGMLGMTLLAHEFHEQADVCFREAARLAPREPKWPYLNARCLEISAPDRAQQLLVRAAGLSGAALDVPRLYLVEKLLEQHELAQAEQHLRPSLTREPESIRAKYALARLHFLREEYRACKQLILETQNRIGQRYQQAKEKASLLHEQGRKAQANAVLATANQQLRESLCQQQTMGMLLAAALRQLGELEATEKQQTWALQQTDREWSDPYFEAVIALRTGLKAQLSRADVALGQGRPARALEILNSTVKRYPDALFAHILLGRALIRVGRLSQEGGNEELAHQHYLQAKDHLQRALEIEPHSVEALFRRGVLAIYWTELEPSVNRLTEAEDAFRKAIELKPDFTMAHYNLAKALDQQGRLMEAIEAMRGTLRCEPNHVDGRHALGVMLWRAGDRAAAAEHLRLALQLDPDNESVRKLLRRVEG